MIWLLSAFMTGLNLFLLRINSQKKMTNYANIFVLLGTGLSCVLMPILRENGYLEVSVSTILYYYMCVFMANFMVKIGYANSKKMYNNKKRECIDISLYAQTIIYVAWIMLIIGIIALYLYTLAFGGYKEYLDDGAFALRIGYSRVVNKWSFLQPFCEFPMISLLVFIWDLHSVKRRKKILSFVGALASAVMCYLVLIANKARMALIIYCLVVLFSVCDMYIKNRARNYAAKGMFAVIAATSVVFVSNVLGRGSNDTIISTLSNGVKFVYNNFFYWFENLSIYNCRFFTDYLIAPLYLLPSRIWSSLMGIQTISEINTVFQAGAHKGTGGVTGEIPVDYYSCAYCQLGVLGMVVIGFLTGVLFRKIDNFTCRFSDKSFQYIVYYYIVFELILRSFTNGDPEAIISRVFPFIFYTIMFYLLFKFRMNKSQEKKNAKENFLEHR